MVEWVKENYVAKIKWEKVTDLPETNRGNGGFGHTGYLERIINENLSKV